VSLELVTLANDSLELTLVPAYGARLHRLRVRGRDVLRTPADVTRHEREPFFWGAYVMAPWCNRATTEPIIIAGREIRLAANFAEGSAIHGQVYLRPWQEAREGEFRIEHGGDGWPWRYAARLRIELEGLSVRLVEELTNLSDSPMPGGLGMHPWFAGQPRIAIHGQRSYRSNTNPDPEPVPVAGPLDLRHATEMTKGVDATWVDLADPAAEVHWPGLHLAMHALTETPHVVAANLPGIDAIAVETETHAPGGLRRLLNGRPGAVALLDSGSTLQLTTVLEFSMQRDESAVP
jgi:aldose 1-epimerase